MLPWLSVDDNIASAAGPRQVHDPRVDTLLAEVGRAMFVTALLKQLSGGMAQRVAMDALRDTLLRGMVVSAA